MDFGTALGFMKSGYRLARYGWNGVGMWVTRSPGCEALPADSFWSEANRNFAHEMGGFATVLPVYTMKTAANQILMGWAPSQSDMEGEDWYVV